jgi:hypothetical protein
MDVTVGTGDRKGLPQEQRTSDALPSRIESRCGTGLSALKPVKIMIGGHNVMARFLFIIPLVLMASAAPAQQQEKQGHDACARDVSRFCRAHMNDGDNVVLACLKQHRDQLSKPCEKVLAEHGH